mmetsp:Transcript_45980/g.109491  ORF Transcript_45980/g.109491 Transcript_45980/m.109491 type:complete len:332 (+) Transcript_45980:98-1093(+)
MADDGPLAALRQKHLSESLARSNEPGWGYFGLAGPLAIGDNSLGVGATRKAPPADGEEPLRNIQAACLKTGKTPDSYFSFSPPLASGDPYVDPFKVAYRKLEQIDPEAAFKPAGLTKFPLNRGIEYIPHMDTVKDPHAVKNAYKDYVPPRNVLSVPTKKGGNGVYTPGVLFGYGEERKFPEHIPDDYDAGRKQRKKELEEHKSKLQELPFRPGDYGNRQFATHAELYHCDQPSHVPRDKQESPFAEMHEQKFRPGGPSKKGILYGCMSPFPPHIPEPSAGGALRKPPPETEPPPPFKVGHPNLSCNPMPSVVTNSRNMRAERPSSYMRPVL